jgi:hypothetical protein
MHKFKVGTSGIEHSGFIKAGEFLEQPSTHLLSSSQGGLCSMELVILNKQTILEVFIVKTSIGR